MAIELKKFKRENKSKNFTYDFLGRVLGYTKVFV